MKAVLAAYWGAIYAACVGVSRVRVKGLKGRGDKMQAKYPHGHSDGTARKQMHNARARWWLARVGASVMSKAAVRLLCAACVAHSVRVVHGLRLLLIARCCLCDVYRWPWLPACA